jgi:hypothetical protein
MDDIAILSPQDSGTGFVIHAYQDFGRRDPRGPRITVFPDRTSADWGVSISVPAEDGEQPLVAGDRSRFAERELARVIDFVRQNRDVLLRYWHDGLYSTRGFLRDLAPAR